MQNEDGAIIKYTVKDLSRDILVPAQLLIPAGRTKALDIKNFFFSNDFKKVLIYTNAKKVWRYETRGDYWIYNFSDSSLETSWGKDCLLPHSCSQKFLRMATKQLM